MKTHLRFIVLLVVLHLLHTLESNAQFTLERKHYFTMGNLYPCHYLSNIPFDTVNKSGQNIIWDFSGATVNVQDTLFVIPPDTTIFFNAPNTNYYLSNLGFWEPEGQYPGFTTSFYSYLLEDSTSINFLGDWANNGLYELWYNHFTDPRLRFSFPLNYSDTIVDSFDGTTLELSQGAWHRNFGLRTIIADGYGDVLINGNLHSNCLRIRVQEILNDSAQFLFNTYLYNEYYWFDPSLNGIILESVFDLTLGNPLNLKTRYFYANPPVVSVQETSSLLDVEVYPNPVSTVIHFDLHTNRNIMRIELVDLYGKLVRSLEYDNFQQLELPVSGLSSGVYILKFISTEGINSRKVIIQ